MSDEGKMFQVIQGEPTEVVRWGDQLLPHNHPLLKECIGQLVLELTHED